MITVKELKKLLNSKYFIIQFLNQNDCYTYVPCSKNEKVFDDWAVESFVYSNEFQRIIFKSCPADCYCPGKLDKNDAACQKCDHFKECEEMDNLS